MNLIVAVDSRWGIGRENGLLTSIPGDMQYFKDHTMGKVVVMGRKTLESMPQRRGLKGRTNLVVTSNPNFEAERCIVVHSDEELLSELSKYDSDDVYLIGGASLYNKYYKQCDKLYITKMFADLNADTFIVNIDEDPDFQVVSESDVIIENDISYRFVIYERKK